MKIVISRVLREPEHKSGTSKTTGKPYSFWTITFLEDSRLINFAGTEEEIKGLDVGSVIEGDYFLKERKYTKKDGSEGIAYDLKKKSEGDKKLEEIKELIEKLTDRVLVLEEALFNRSDEPPHTDEDAPEIDMDDIPF